MFLPNVSSFPQNSKGAINQQTEILMLHARNLSDFVCASRILAVEACDVVYLGQIFAFCFLRIVC